MISQSLRQKLGYHVEFKVSSFQAPQTYGVFKIFQTQREVSSFAEFLIHLQ